jgi:hypothetical protein
MIYLVVGDAETQLKIRATRFWAPILLNKRNNKDYQCLVLTLIADLY